MRKEELQNIGDIIASSEFYKKYGYKDHWTSGSCTDVPPISIWGESNCIEIQLDCKVFTCAMKKAFNKLVNAMPSVKRHYLCKYDGSCPNVAKIYFN